MGGATGGSFATGGRVSTGGVQGVGGRIGTGGSTASGGGGRSATGGITAMGGTISTGGRIGNGGSGGGTRGLNRDAGASDAQSADVVIDTRKPACTDQVLLGHSSAVGGVAFSPDGQFLASAGNDHIAKIWRVSDGTLVVTLSGSSSPLTSVAYTPDGQTLVAGGGSATYSNGF